jgi:hypothetical protein
LTHLAKWEFVGANIDMAHLDVANLSLYFNGSVELILCLLEIIIIVIIKLKNPKKLPHLLQKALGIVWKYW